MRPFGASTGTEEHGRERHVGLPHEARHPGLRDRREVEVEEEGGGAVGCGDGGGVGEEGEEVLEDIAVGGEGNPLVVP